MSTNVTQGTDCELFEISAFFTRFRGHPRFAVIIPTSSPGVVQPACMYSNNNRCRLSRVLS
eukprot:6827281-Pyramimonas_sp.AAC.1